MALKDIWAETSNWLRARKLYRPLNSRPELDEEGLISQDNDIESLEKSQHTSNHPGSRQTGESSNDEVIVNAIPQKDNQAAITPAPAETLEKLQKGFDKLIKRLEGINEHLDHQAAQHEELMGRIQKLPQILEGFPDAIENQKQITEQLLEQLKASVAKNEQFVDAVEQIPNQTAKQTDALVNIDHQLAAAADIDVQMAQSFNNFNQSLEKLNESTISHTEGIVQMSKTFSASDRYLKYIISKQNKRFMWVFIAAVSICMTAILILTGIIIYLRHS